MPKITPDICKVCNLCEIKSNKNEIGCLFRIYRDDFDGYSPRQNYLKEYRLKHPDKVRNHRRQRRALSKGAKGIHTSEDVLKQGEFQEWKCWWCGKLCQDKYHEDHYISLSRGGSNWASNIVISCPRCNWKKHNKSPDEFIKYIKNYPDEFK